MQKYIFKGIDKVYNPSIPETQDAPYMAQNG